MRRYASKLALIGLGVGAICLFIAAASCPGEKIELRTMIVDWNDATREAIDKVIVPAFEKENPNITVKVEYTHWAGYMEKTTTAFQGGISPDVFQGGAVWAAKVGEYGWALPLDDFISKSPDFNWEDFFPVYREDCVIKGKIVGVPYRADVRPFLYRESLLKEAGVKPPDTWEELKEAAVKCTKRENGKIVQCGYNFFFLGARGFQLHQAFLPFLYQGGGTILNEEETEAAINGPGGVGALELVNTLINDLKVCPTPVGMEQIGGVTPIILGKSAMISNSYSVLFGDMKKYNPDQYDDLMAKLPLKGPVKRATHAWVNKFFISSQSKHPEEGWKLLVHFLSPKYSEIYSEAFVCVPGRRSMIERPFFKGDQKLGVALQSSEYAHTFPKKPYVFDMFKPINDGILATLYGYSSAQDALNQTAREINKLIKFHEKS